MGKRIFLATTWAALLASSGCLRDVCERHGYYPSVPPAAPGCCVPCVCQPAAPAGYVAPASNWNAPASVPATCPAGCVPAH
ncbi:MAG TPA: hypothetical protein VMF69_24105 [Gemmataceae bacterium]|nr:hypothetical protein [Gemmataceae bacterium]